MPKIKAKAQTAFIYDYLHQTAEILDTVHTPHIVRNTLIPTPPLALLVIGQVPMKFITPEQLAE